MKKNAFTADGGPHGQQRVLDVADGLLGIGDFEAAEMLTAYAATLRQQAAQPDDSRCPPTYRREEAVKVLIGMGWSWDGKQWNAPVQQAARVDDRVVERVCAALMQNGWHTGGDENEFLGDVRAALAAAPSAPQDAQKEHK